jgi:quercetin dioxygenase-like cupin family protein
MYATTGDIVVVEPGEVHHPAVDEDGPSVVLWLRAGSERHKQHS